MKTSYYCTKYIIIHYSIYFHFTIFFYLHKNIALVPITILLDGYWYQKLSGSQDPLTYVGVNYIKAIQIENANGTAYHSVTIVSLAITLSSKLHIGLWIPTLVYFTINVIFRS